MYIIIVVKTYLITYDLSEPNRDYELIHKGIMNLGDSCWCLRSVWLVKTALSSKEIREKLDTYLDSDDILLVAPVVSPIASIRLDPVCKLWLNKNL